MKKRIVYSIFCFAMLLAHYAQAKAFKLTLKDVSYNIEQNSITKKWVLKKTEKGKNIWFKQNSKMPYEELYLDLAETVRNFPSNSLNLVKDCSQSDYALVQWIELRPRNLTLCETLPRDYYFIRGLRQKFENLISKR